MGNKAPKMRERYRLRVPNSGLIEVTRDVYLAYYQAKRRERYQTELCCKHKVTTAPEVLLKSVWDIEEIVAKKIVNEALYICSDEILYTACKNAILFLGKRVISDGEKSIYNRVDRYRTQTVRRSH